MFIYQDFGVETHNILSFLCLDEREVALCKIIRELVSFWHSQKIILYNGK